MKYIILVVSLSILFSCTENKVSEKRFYNSGKLKSHYFYLSAKDTMPFKVINYYENGEVMDTNYYNRKGQLEGYLYYNNIKGEYKRWANYHRGLRNGISMVKKHNGDNVIQFFKNDTLNGIEYQYDSLGRLSREVLWIKEKALVLKEICRPNVGDTLMNFVKTADGLHKRIEIVSDTLLVQTYYDIIDGNNPNPIGSLLFDNKGIIGSHINNSYQEVNMADTIERGLPLLVRVNGHYGNFKDVNLEVEIGDINNKFEFITKTKKYSSPKGILTLEFEISDYQNGYNLLLGKVKLKRDSIVFHESFLFEDYWVFE
ncbi:MAG: hypothetical protein QM786_13060 [Breznakibacter sp.]